MVQKKDMEYMQECLNLAKRGLGKVSPNPMVGAIIVKGNKIIARAYHSNFGEEHAESKAIKKTSKLACKGATLYLNLEPCVHYGKTPPCVEKVIAADIKKVVIGTLDPNPLVQGKGVRKMRKAGVRVETGVLAKECRELNRTFFKYMKTGLPYLTVKIAQTADGFIAKPSGQSKWITSKDSRSYVHRLRGQNDGILVGANTVLKDNPQLTLHKQDGTQPWRIILDRRARTPKDSYILTDEFRDKTIIISKKQSLRYILKDLAKQGISSILIEGGAQIYESFLKEGLVDELFLFTSHKRFEEGLRAFNSAHLRQFKEIQEKKISTDTLRIFHRK